MNMHLFNPKQMYIHVMSFLYKKKFHSEDI